jgi:uncharacterized protein YkwD
MWAMTIASGVSGAQMTNGCSHALMTDERIAAVALRHAEHQASVDMLTSMSPDGDLFDQVATAGVTFTAAAALFGGARGAPDRVVERWAAGMDTAEVLRRCDDMIGVGVATSDASGTSYITVLLAKN